MKKILFFLLIFCQLACFAQIPKPTGHLVNDYADVLSSKEESALENQLRAYYDTTHNTVLLILTPDLNGYEIADYAQRIGDAWKVGMKGQNNGIVIVIKPKNNTSGEAFIATGYGLEGVLPDITCHHIVEDYMIPHFENDDYYEGICAGIEVVCPLAAKEFSYEDLKKREREQEKEEMLDAAKGFGGVLLALLSFLGINSFFKKHPTKRMRRKAALKSAKNARSAAAFHKACCAAKAAGASEGELAAAQIACWTQALNNIEYAKSVSQLEVAMDTARELGLSEEEINNAKTNASKHALNNISTAGSETAITDAAELAILLGLSVLAIERARKAAMAALRDSTTSAFPRNGGLGGFGGGRSSMGGGSFGGFGGGRFGGGGGGGKW